MAQSSASHLHAYQSDLQLLHPSLQVSCKSGMHPLYVEFTIRCHLLRQSPHLAVFLVFRLFAVFLAGGFKRFRAL